MQQESSVEEGSSNTWRALSDDFASAIEKAGPFIVALHGRRRIPSSGVHWHPGIIVSADHTLERDEEIKVTLPGGSVAAATVAGRDRSTDLAILKLANTALPLPTIAGAGSLKVGNWVLAAALTAEGGPRASFALVGVVGPEWRTWSGGVLDQTLRLDRNLHPNFSGGPAIDDQGRVIGISTSGLSRYASVVIPASTVERVVSELETKGHISQGYLGVAMQPVHLPDKVRTALNLTDRTAILIVRVEPDGPAEKAGMIIGDVLVALDGNPVTDVDDVRAFLSGDRIGKSVRASIIRGGSRAELTITVSENLAASN